MTWLVIAAGVVALLVAATLIVEWLLDVWR
jgi:hypothetical protein